jgi:hypothetical protein
MLAGMNRDKSIPIDPPAGMTWRFQVDSLPSLLVDHNGNRPLGNLQLWDAAALKRHLKKLRQKRTHDYGWHEGMHTTQPVYREDQVFKLSRQMVKTHLEQRRRKAAEETAIERLRRAIGEMGR